MSGRQWHKPFHADQTQAFLGRLVDQHVGLHRVEFLADAWDVDEMDAHGAFRVFHRARYLFSAVVDAADGRQIEVANGGSVVLIFGERLFQGIDVGLVGVLGPSRSDAQPCAYNTCQNEDAAAPKACSCHAFLPDFLIWPCKTEAENADCAASCTASSPLERRRCYSFPWLRESRQLELANSLAPYLKSVDVPQIKTAPCGAVSLQIEPLR